MGSITISPMQLVARSMNLRERRNDNKSKKKVDEKQINYKRKKISEKQRLHLEKARKRRWPKSDKVKGNA